MVKVTDYVPVLKWKQGEYQALMRLSDESKKTVIPLIVIPPIGYDFEEQRLKKTAHEHVKTFPKRYIDKWGERPAFVEIHDSLETSKMEDGMSVLSFVFENLRRQDAKAIPVATFSKGAAYLHELRTIIAAAAQGAAVRAKLTDLMKASFQADLNGILLTLDQPPQNVDLLLDLGGIEFSPFEGLSKALIVAIKKISDLQIFRSFVLMATSFPQSLTHVGKPGGVIVRDDWKFYQYFMRHKPEDIRAPTYGDYGIENPDFVQFDPRKMTPSGKLIYTTPDSWILRKGAKFRGNESQQITHCKNVISSGHFKGGNYSEGDRYIEDCAGKLRSTGNLTTWKWVGLNHHITQVAEDLASFHANRTSP